MDTGSKVRSLELIFHYDLFKSVLINQLVPPSFRLCFAFTGINFRGMLHHICDIAYGENMCGPIRTCKCRNTNLLTICKEECR